MNRTITKALAVAAALSMGVTTLAACGSSNSVDESKGKVYYLTSSRKRPTSGKPSPKPTPRKPAYR